jgi:RNA polymerase primary sigma factor
MPDSSVSIGPYAADAGRTPLLTAGREVELGRAIFGRDPCDPAVLAARNELIRSNLRLVISIARAFVGRGLDLDDLIGWGNAGLCLAADRYDPGRTHLGRPVRFSTYATYWVRMTIRRALQDAGGPIRIPVYLQAARARWHAGGPRHPRLDVVDALLARSWRRIGPGVDGYADDEEIPAPAAPPHPRAGGAGEADGPGEEPEWAEKFRAVSAALGRLRASDADLIRRRFGLGGTPETLAEIGRSLGITKEAVRQRAVAAVRSLAIEMGVEPPGSVRMRKGDRARREGRKGGERRRKAE